MPETTQVKNIIVKTAGQFIAEFFEELKKITGLEPQEFQAYALQKTLRRTLNDLYRLNLSREALQHIISICRFMVRIYHGEEEFNIERSVVTFVDVLSKFVIASKSMFLLNCALFLIDNSDQKSLEYFIGALFYAFDLLTNKYIIETVDHKYKLKILLSRILSSRSGQIKEFYAKFSEIFFIDRPIMIAAL